MAIGSETAQAQSAARLRGDGEAVERMRAPAPSVPFNRPFAAPQALQYTRLALESGHLCGDGPFSKRCHALLEATLGAPKVLLTTSCTHALEMSGLLLELGPGDEVIIPSFTFPSTVNAYVLRGVKPVFCDIRPDTLNIDEQRIERLITPRTKALVVVHYAGVACEMDAIAAIAARHGLAVVEDNAHGLLGTYKGRPLGTFGALATQSFHETKNFSCGEGGALVINDPRFIERAEILREKGTNRNRFHRGQVDKYTWVDVGSSYLPSDLLAALLLAQLESRHLIQAQRRALWQTYSTQLAEWAAMRGVQLPIVPAHCEQAYHMFYLLMPSARQRQALISHLKAQNIAATFHYLPLHLSEMGRRFGARPGDCPVTEDLSHRQLRLPYFADLRREEQERVIDAVLEFV